MYWFVDYVKFNKQRKNLYRVTVKAESQCRQKYFSVDKKLRLAALIETKNMRAQLLFVVFFVLAIGMKETLVSAGGPTGADLIAILTDNFALLDVTMLTDIRAALADLAETTDAAAINSFANGVIIFQQLVSATKLHCKKYS